jgi:hypothetical protein
MINQLVTLIHPTTQRPYLNGINPVSVAPEDFVPPSNWEQISHNYPKGNMIGPIYMACMRLLFERNFNFAIFAQAMSFEDVKQIVVGVQMFNDAISLSCPLRPSQPNQYDTMAVTIWLVLDPLVFQQVQIYLTELLGDRFEIHRSLSSPN